VGKGREEVLIQIAERGYGHAKVLKGGTTGVLSGMAGAPTMRPKPMKRCPHRNSQVPAGALKMTDMKMTDHRNVQA